MPVVCGKKQRTLGDEFLFFHTTMFFSPFFFFFFFLHCWFTTLAKYSRHVWSLLELISAIDTT